MKVITRQGRANGAAASWWRQYKGGRYGQDKLDVLDKLNALGNKPNPDDVDNVIGNKSWTNLSCNECGKYRLDVVVRVGEEPDYESSTAYLCKDCIKKAYNLINEKE